MSLKKIIMMIFTFVAGFIFMNEVYAASANISVSASKSTVQVGDTVEVTIAITSGSALGSWEFDLSYDSAYWSISSSNLEGTTKSTNNTINNTTKEKKYKVKLKAKKSGSTKVGVKNVLVFGWDESKMTTTSGSKTFTLKTKSEIDASKSSNNNLNSLSISNYSISPKFNKDTKNYTLTVNNDVKEVKVNASKADSKASISGTGTRKLDEGSNKLDITVTAENGSKKTYTITVTRKELDPIKVNIDGKEYTVVRKADKLKKPDNYNDTKIKIDDKEVPAFKSDITNYTLVGLTNSDGDTNLYIYNDGKYTLYKEVKIDGITLYLKEPDSYFDDSSEVKVKIDDNDITFYELKDYPYKVIYGMNTKTGKENWYSYDEDENTIQRFAGINEVVTCKNGNKKTGSLLTKTAGTTDNKFFILSIILGGLCLLFFITTLILTIRQKKKVGINY